MTNIDLEYRNLVAKILRASTKIAIDHQRGPANFVRVPDTIIDKFPGYEIAGIQVHGDLTLNESVIVGRIDDSGFIVEEIINL
jgi:hypothetical protein